MGFVAPESAYSGGIQAPAPSVTEQGSVPQRTSPTGGFIAPESAYKPYDPMQVSPTDSTDSQSAQSSKPLSMSAVGNTLKDIAGTIVIGMPEALSHYVTGAAGLIAGDATAIAAHTPIIGENGVQAVQTGQKVQDFLTDNPETQYGKNVVSAVNRLFTPLTAIGNFAGSTVGNVTGDAVAGKVAGDVVNAVLTKKVGDAAPRIVQNAVDLPKTVSTMAGNAADTWQGSTLKEKVMTGAGILAALHGDMRSAAEIAGVLLAQRESSKASATATSAAKAATSAVETANEAKIAAQQTQKPDLQLVLAKNGPPNPAFGPNTPPNTPIAPPSKLIGEHESFYNEETGWDELTPAGLAKLTPAERAEWNDNGTYKVDDPNIIEQSPVETPPSSTFGTRYAATKARGSSSPPLNIPKFSELTELPPSATFAKRRNLVDTPYTAAEMAARRTSPVSEAQQAWADAVSASEKALAARKAEQGK